MSFRVPWHVTKYNSPRLIELINWWIPRNLSHNFTWTLSTETWHLFVSSNKQTKRTKHTHINLKAIYLSLIPPNRPRPTKQQLSNNEHNTTSAPKMKCVFVERPFSHTLKMKRTKKKKHLQRFKTIITIHTIQFIEYILHFAHTT